MTKRRLKIRPVLITLNVSLLIIIALFYTFRLVKYYLNPNGTPIYGGEIANGKYYNGNTVSAVNKKYATDKNWANKVYNYMEYLYKKI